MRYIMSKQYDSWCSPLHRENQPPLYGGAARNVRVARSGGMDVIINRAGRRAAKEALEEANLFVTAANDTQNVIPMKKKTRGKNS
ncbi:MAG: hypothetical protein RJA83_773 [Pseudomonadota bacterium]